jgi:CHAT domain-containing protein
MELSELFTKDKPAARLVVLSACETALGKDYKGEGVFSFSREFATLGIPASVSNLWSVDNESTYRITEWFYQFVANGLPTDEALRQAKLKFIEESTGEKKLPFYWASPILTGKAEIIRTKPRFPFGDIIAIVVITGAALWLMSRKQKRKRTI